MLTNQEAFDKAVSGVLAQGRRSYGVKVPGGVSGCLLRGPGGAKCAIGHLIPDDMYKENMECLGPDRLCSMFGVDPLLGGRLLCDHDTQFDGVDYIANYRERSLDTAKRFNLDPKVLSCQN